MPSIFSPVIPTCVLTCGQQIPGLQRPRRPREGDTVPWARGSGASGRAQHRRRDSARSPCAVRSCTLRRPACHFPLARYRGDLEIACPNCWERHWDARPPRDCPSTPGCEVGLLVTLRPHWPPIGFGRPVLAVRRALAQAAPCARGPFPALLLPRCILACGSGLQSPRPLLMAETYPPSSLTAPHPFSSQL